MALKKYYEKWMFADSPWLGWSIYENDPNHSFPGNPMEIEYVHPLPHEVKKLIGGDEMLITQIQSDTDHEKTNKRQLTMRFPETDRDEPSIEYLAGKYRLGQNVAIRPFNLFDTGDDHEERLTPSSDNSYYYTPFGPFDLSSFKVYDKFGNEVWVFGSGNEADPYGITVEPDKGRIQMGNTIPALGELFAIYDPIFYGKIIRYDPNPVPMTNPTEFGPEIVLKELDWPTVETGEGTYYLYLRDTALTVGGLGGASNVYALDTNEGHGGGGGEEAVTGLRLLSRTKGSSEKRVLSATEDASGTDHWDYNGTWAIKMANSVIPKGNKFVVAASIQGFAGSPSGPTAYLGAYLYIYRPGVGLIASLLSNDSTHRYTLKGGAEFGGNEPDDANWGTWALVKGQVMDSSVEVHEGDYLVLELWVWYHHSGQQETYAVWFDGDADAYPENRGATNPASETTKDGAAQLISIYPLYISDGADE